MPLQRAALKSARMAHNRDTFCLNKRRKTFFNTINLLKKSNKSLPLSSSLIRQFFTIGKKARKAVKVYASRFYVFKGTKPRLTEAIPSAVQLTLAEA